MAKSSQILRPSRAPKRPLVPKKLPGLALDLVKEARALWLRGKRESAKSKFLAAWRAAPENKDLLVYVSNVLADLNAQTEAIELLEAAVAYHGTSEEICMIMGRMAVRLQLYDVAEKVFHLAISVNPQNATHYVNLTSALKAQRKFDEAITLLQDILPLFPENGKLWSNLAQVVSEKDGTGSYHFHLEAVKHCPDDYEVLTNYANVAYAKPLERPYAAVGDSEDAYRVAIKLDPNRPEAHIGLAIQLLAEGKLEEAWPHYEYRLDTSLGQNKAAIYTHGLRRWKGQKLEGKSLMVSAEQGIGDEVFFAMMYPDLLKQNARLYVGCDPRLVGILERSFAGLEAAAFSDELRDGCRYRSFPDFEDKKIDFEIPLASLPKHLWRVPSDLPDRSVGYLKSCPDRAADFKKQCNAAAAGQLKIGLSWRSGKLTGERANSYLTLELLKGLFDIPGVTLFNLQYDADQQEISQFEKAHDVELRQFEGVDLKQDIEANLGILENMDLVIGPPIATQMFSVALGKPTWFLCHGAPWWSFGTDSTESLWFSKNSRCFMRTLEEGDDWDVPVTRMVEAVRKLSESSEK